MGVGAILQPRGRSALAAVTVGILGVLASINPGVPVSEVSLHDGGVWVTNEQLRLVAHLNYASRTLDGGLRAPSPRFDISQAAGDVLIHDAEGAAVLPIDVATVSAAAPVRVAGVHVVQGGSLLAVSDPAAGRVWGIDVSALGSFSPETATPLLEGLPGAQALVGVDGAIHALGKDGRLSSADRIGDSWGAPRSREVKSVAAASRFLTSVGPDAVVLDRDSQTLHLPGRDVVDPSFVDGVLQIPGEIAESVTVATPTELLVVSLGDGEIRRISSGVSARGVPVAPVVLGGCRYAAWAGVGRYIRDCPGEADDVAQGVEKLRTAKNLVFRTNRDVVVINDTNNGDVFLASKQVQLVNNWKDILAALDSTESNDTKSPETQQEQALPQRDDKNRKPDAVNDSFGVRPGRATVLPVLQNDSDPDGDVLTAVPGNAPSWASSLRSGRGGGALVLDVPANATGSGTFSYTAADGRGESDDAAVSLSVHPWTTNSPPEQWRPQSSVTLVAGGQAQYDVRPDWLDPDGDPFYIASVTAPEGMTAKFREDGVVTVRDLGKLKPGRYQVKIVMRDERDSTEGVLNVDVRDRAAVPPVANADHVRVIKDREVVVTPLKNDTDANGDELRLAQVSPPPAGARVIMDSTTGTFRFSSSVAGTIYLDYVVSDGPSTATGVVRVDVVDVDPNGQPTAEDDVALLPAGGRTTVAVLDNDFDPAGGVLVVQSFSVKPDSGLTVEVLDREKLRISAAGGLKAQASFTYSVSNGSASATGTVVVIPLAAVPTSAPPVAEDDAATVRVGDLVTVHVMDNDTSPSGLPMSVESELQFSGTQAQGEAFVSQGTIRFKAGDQPGTVRVVYTLRDSQGNFDSAQVEIAVHGPDGNSPPVARPLVARVLAGASSRIPVPLDMIDSDGDSVALLGVDTPPTKGTVKVGTSWLEYVAPAGTSGTDSFTYAVMDRYGARGIGTIHVGIAPPSPVNQPPTTVPDTVVARPDRQLSIAVLANDTDPDGDPLQLLDGSVKGQGAASVIGAVTDGARVQLRSPSIAGIYALTYTVVDGRGGSRDGTITLDIRTDTPLQPPIARDDLVAGADVAGKGTVEVDVLANDEDRDGAAEALAVTASGSGVVVGPKGVVTVTVMPARQVILYTVTDVDALTAKAAIVVPGSNERLPTLKPDKVPAKIKGGETLTVNLSEFVSVREGHAPRLTFEDRIKAGPGGDGAPLVKDPTTLVFTTKGEFSGQTSVTFEVTDGATSDDPQGLTAVLTLPIVVESSGKNQPVLTPSELQVAAGEPAKTFDLAAMVRDPDPGDLERLTFTLDNQPSGFAVELRGTDLLVSAPPETEAGTQALLNVTLTDGSTTPVKGTIPVRSVSSTRPLISITEVVISTAKAGTPETIDVTKVAVNPFADLGKSLTMVGQPNIQIGSGTASGDASQIVVTPAVGFHGQMTVRYTLADATKDVKRQVEGRILLTVRDRPEPPIGVTALTQESRTATLAWSAGANNGAPITKFSVRWSSGSKDCGAVTTCTITGLTNNVEYTFTVVATNEVGDSDPSAQSNMVRPDVKPNQPAAPTVTFGDKQAAVSWSTPPTDGSPVEGFTVEIDGPTGGATQTKLGLVNSYTWNGLTNGASYRFRVQAHSKAQQPSDFSTYSAIVIPAGLPLNLTAPTVSADAPSSALPSMTVSWAAPNGNGDSAMTYELREVGKSTVAWTGTTTTARLSLPSDTTDKRFEYRAQNKAGWSSWSPASNAVRAFQTPGAVSNLTATATGTNNQVQMAFTDAAGNGAKPTEMTYYWSTGGFSAVLPANRLITDARLANGTSYSISVFAKSTVNGISSQFGPSVAAPGVVPYGPPFPPQVSASGGVNSVTLSWNAGSSGNGRPIAEVQIETTDGGIQSVALSGNVSQGNGRNQTKSIRARAKDSTGLWSGWSVPAAGSTWGNPSYSWGEGEWIAKSPPSFCSDGCWKISLTLRQYNPNSIVHCAITGQGAKDWTIAITVDGGGNWGTAIPYGYAGGGRDYAYADPGFVSGGICQQR